MNALLAAVCAAIVVQPVVCLLWLLDGVVTGPWALKSVFADLQFKLAEVYDILRLVLLVSAAAVILLGLPAFLLLRRYQKATDVWVASVGFAIPSLTMILFEAPWRVMRDGTGWSGKWHGRDVDFVVGGAKTAFFWLSTMEDVILLGMNGLVGAVVFLAVWRRVSGRADFNPH